MRKTTDNGKYTNLLVLFPSNSSAGVEVYGPLLKLLLLRPPTELLIKLEPSFLLSSNCTITCQSDCDNQIFVTSWIGLALKTSLAGGMAERSLSSPSATVDVLAGKELVQSRSSIDTVAEGMTPFLGEKSLGTGWKSSQARVPPMVPKPASASSTVPAGATEVSQDLEKNVMRSKLWNQNPTCSTNTLAGVKFLRQLLSIELRASPRKVHCSGRHKDPG